MGNGARGNAGCGWDVEYREQREYIYMGLLNLINININQQRDNIRNKYMKKIGKKK